MKNQNLTVDLSKEEMININGGYEKVAYIGRIYYYQLAWATNGLSLLF